MLVGPTMGKTAVCGCHCPRGMALRMREVLAQPWVGVLVHQRFKFALFSNAIELNSLYYSSVTVFHDDFLNKFNSMGV